MTRDGFTLADGEGMGVFNAVLTLMEEVVGWFPITLGKPECTEKFWRAAEAAKKESND